MPSAVGGALYASQIDGDAVIGRGRTKFVEVPSLRLNRLTCILSEDRFLQWRVESRSIGKLQPKRITRHQSLAENYQSTALLCSLLHVDLHLLKRRCPVQPNRSDLCEADREKVAVLGLS